MSQTITSITTLMLYVYLSYIFFSPLIGIIFLEHGYFGESFGGYGYSNTSSLAYAIFLLIILLTYFVAKFFVYRFTFTPNPFIKMVSQTRKKNLMLLIFLLLVLIAAFFFCVSGANEVWSGKITKGIFRKSLGSWGGVSYYFYNILCPSLLAYSCLIFVSIKDTKNKPKLILLLSFIAVALFGATWGFKTSALTILLPAFLILFWRINIKQILIISCLGLSLIALFSLLFDQAQLSSLPTKIMNRLLIIPGDMPWMIWESFKNNPQLFQKSQNFYLAAFGDSFLQSFFRISPYSEQWTSTHFSVYLTSLAGYPDGGLTTGHNLIGTTFSESIILLRQYFTLFPIGVGVLLAGMVRTVESSMANNRLVWAPLTASYAILVFSQWLNGGGITILFHIATVMQLFLTAIILNCLNFLLYFDLLKRKKHVSSVPSSAR